MFLLIFRTLVLIIEAIALNRDEFRRLFRAALREIPPNRALNPGTGEALRLLLPSPLNGEKGWG